MAQPTVEYTSVIYNKDAQMEAASHESSNWRELLHIQEASEGDTVLHEVLFVNLSSRDDREKKIKSSSGMWLYVDL